MGPNALPAKFQILALRLLCKMSSVVSAWPGPLRPMEHVRASAVKRVSTFLARLAKVLFFFVVFALSTNLVFFSMFESLRYLYRLPRKLYLLSKGSLPFGFVWLALLRYAFCFFFFALSNLYFFSKKNLKFRFGCF